MRSSAPSEEDIDMARTRRILHPTDFSSASRAALAKAIELARAQKAELVVCHVVSPFVPMLGEGYMTPRMYEEIATSTRQGAQRQLDAVVARARRAGARVRGLLVEGTPFDRIGRVARSQKAGLVVMGTHGRSALGRLFLGSVAERVVATSPVPVLTVRGR
jgi:nucleotide-binding universal stress UspA family protein